MDKLAKALLSMRAMAVGMFIFLSGIAVATFIESDQGIQAAKLWVYNALWFEILILFLTINMVANIFRYRMWSREKIAMLLFHLSFIVIMIGAGVTRYISFEGTMPIREGETSNVLYSADPYLWVRINDGEMQATNDTKVFMAESYPFNNANLNLWLLLKMSDGYIFALQLTQQSIAVVKRVAFFISEYKINIRIGNTQMLQKHRFAAVAIAGFSSSGGCFCSLGTLNTKGRIFELQAYYSQLVGLRIADAKACFHFFYAKGNLCIVFLGVAFGVANAHHTGLFQFHATCFE